jgi:hypothetical protein
VKLATQALAVVLGIVGHSFIFMAATADSVGRIVVCLACVVCLWAAAWLLFRRTMT